MENKEWGAASPSLLGSKSISTESINRGYIEVIHNDNGADKDKVNT